MSQQWSWIKLGMELFSSRRWTTNRIGPKVKQV